MTQKECFFACVYARVNEKNTESGKKKDLWTKTERDMDSELETGQWTDGDKDRNGDGNRV